MHLLIPLVMSLALFSLPIYAYSQTGDEQRTVNLKLQVRDPAPIHYETERAKIQIILHNPTDKPITAHIDVFDSSVPPTETYGTATGRFTIPANDYYPFEYTTIKMWSGPWQILATVSGNYSEQFVDSDGSILAQAAGELDHSFRVYSFTDIMFLILGFFGVPGGIAAFWQLRKPKQQAQAATILESAVPRKKTRREIIAEKPYRDHHFHPECRFLTNL